MKTNRSHSLLAAVLVLWAVNLACGAGAAPEPTLIPPTSTNTPSPTGTPTRTPTSTFTPQPTVISTPTPAPIGVPVRYKSLEVTVLDVINRPSIHFGDVSGNLETFYQPLKGHYLIDVAILVRNLDPGSTFRLKWSNVYIVESNGDAWYPGWGSIETVDAEEKADPFTIGLSSTPLNGDDTVEFRDDTYMRLVFNVMNSPDQTILFAIEDSPYISFQPGD